MKSLKQEVLEKRYFLKDENGEIKETWADLCNRVSKSISFNLEEKEQFYDVMHNCDFLPNSPVLMNSGINEKFTMSACFVIDIKDNMESIFEAVKQSALISKMGGGCGYDFSVLRPENSKVGSTDGVASGPLSFIEVFDKATECIKQGGKRRGANMAIMRIDHPDIEKFIDAKLTNGHYSNFNFSVAITDEFMKAVKEDKTFQLKFNAKQFKIIKAKDLWNKICENAWKNGEPGVIFIDKINEKNVLKEVCGDIAATNPCGEQPLYSNECCVLGSINLSNLYQSSFKWYMNEKCKNIKEFNEDLFNWFKLREIVETGVKMLDNIIDIQQYPNEQFEKFHKSNRKIGFGVMGFADLLIKLGVTYGSDLSFEIAEDIMEYIESVATEMSFKLGFNKGFPENMSKAGIDRRNATITTIAPTGTLSILAECSSGIEPNFDFRIEHNRLDEKYITFHPLYDEFKESNGLIDYDDSFIKASDVSAENHVKMQAAFQKYTDNAVSKTINMSNGAIVKDVKKAYESAYELGCKGVTVYRDGSRENQVLSSSNNKKPIVGNIKPIKKIDPENLPELMNSKRIKVKTPEGDVFINISFLENKPYEIFIHSPADTKHSEIYEAIARLISAALRYEVPLKEILSQLRKAYTKYGSVMSIPHAICKAFDKSYLFDDVKQDTEWIHHLNRELCLDCSNVLVEEEGCKKCYSCGYSACN